MRSPPEGDAERPHREAGHSDTSRAAAFSDAVFAIVLTLLVLDLRTPQVPRGQLLVGLWRQWPTYLAFVTSFLYVAVVWLNHKAVFDHVRWMDRPLHWLNVGILFTTTLLPFPTAVVSAVTNEGDLTDERVAVGLYAVVGGLLCVSWFGFFQYLERHPELLEPGLREGFFARESGRAALGVVLYGAAGLVGALVAPTVALAIFLALPVFYGVTSHGLGRAHEEAPAAE